MRNPYDKFQNSSMHVSKIMLYIEKRDEQTDGRPPKKQYAPPTSSKCNKDKYFRRNIRKRTFGQVRPMKIQISMRIRAVWSES